MKSRAPPPGAYARRLEQVSRGLPSSRLAHAGAPARRDLSTLQLRSLPIRTIRTRRPERTVSHDTRPSAGAARSDGKSTQRRNSMRRVFASLFSPSTPRAPSASRSSRASSRSSARRPATSDPSSGPGSSCRNGGGSDLPAASCFIPSGALRAARRSRRCRSRSQSDETVSFPDIVDAMGASGLGTLDMMLPAASSSPGRSSRASTTTPGRRAPRASPRRRSTRRTRLGSPVMTAGTAGILLAPSDPTTSGSTSACGRSPRAPVARSGPRRDGADGSHGGEVLRPELLRADLGGEFVGVALARTTSIEITVEPRQPHRLRRDDRQHDERPELPVREGGDPVQLALSRSRRK